MGRVFDAFGHLTYANEAEVSQKFVVPLLTEFLGYDRNLEIIPERNLPSFKIPINRENYAETKDLRARPDYALALGPIPQVPPVAILDSKGPDEDLGEHIDQLHAYCLAAKTNLLVITNGREFRIFDATELLFLARDIEALDLQFAAVQTLLSRESAAAKGLHARLIDVVPITSAASAATEGIRKAQVAISDFVPYLEHVQRVASAATMLPATVAAALAGQPRHVGSGDLLQVRVAHGTRPLRDALGSVERSVVIGESGIGKTTLLHELLEHGASRCLAAESVTIPVLLRLGEYTHTRSFEMHIANRLAAGGVDLPIERVHDLLRTGRVHLLLDAYDEAFAEELPHLFRALNALVRDYERCPVTLTTRALRKPAVGMVEFKLAELSIETIERFVSLQLGAERGWAFLEELRSRRLLRAASNTLILSLMILLFQRTGSLPPTRRLALEAIFDAVTARERQKATRFKDDIPWGILEQFLGALAFEAFLGDGGYLLEQARVNRVLADAISEAESVHLLQAGLSINQVIDHLVATGFVTKTDSGIVFWHRAIMEHIASKEAARRIDRGEIEVAEVARQPRWYAVLPSAVARCDDPVSAMKQISQANVFMAAPCAAEQPDAVEMPLRQRLVSHLATLVQSPFIDVRREAITALRLLPWDESTAAFRNMLMTGAGQAQADALHELACRQPNSVFALLDLEVEWGHSDEPNAFTPGSALVAALGESTSEQAQDRILEIWQSTPDLFTGWEARRALLKLRSRRLLSPRTVERLTDWLLEDDEHFWRKSDLVELLSALKQHQASRRIIEAIRITAPADSLWELSRALPAIEDKSLRRLIFEAAGDVSITEDRRETFARALSEMDDIPLEWLRTLYSDSSLRIRAFGLRGLQRRPFAEIAEFVDAAFDQAASDSQRIDAGYDFLQATAFSVLAEAGQLERLLDPARRRFPLTVLGAHRLLEVVSAQRLTAFVPILSDLIDRVHRSPLIANLYCSLAELEAPGAMVRLEQLAREGDQYQLAQILERVHRLPHDEAARVVDHVWQRVIGGASDSSFLHNRCIETMEQLGLREQLKDAVQWSIENDPHHVESERAVRAMLGLAAPADEEWAIALVARSQRRGSFGLPRALQLLGQIGEQLSLNVLAPFLGDSSWTVRNSAFWATRNIHERGGEAWWKGLELLPG